MLSDITDSLLMVIPPSDVDNLDQFFGTLGRYDTCASEYALNFGFAQMVFAKFENIQGLVVHKPLYVALAQRKVERKARMLAQFSQVRLVAVAPALAPCVAMYPPGAPGKGTTGPTPETPQNMPQTFVTLLQEDEFFSTRLRIPELVADSMENLNELIIMTGPDPTMMRVTILHTSSANFLRDGWTAIVDLYQLMSGFILHFQYHIGNMYFLTVFGPHGSQIFRGFYSNAEEDSENSM
ncbi:hypothetical protein DM860_016743 [Cuscuta australis]|uniref:RRM domain-containing protein n=1 Tax=Cuscuta australis TaxID=267555 RepID=A0A328DAE9_9ASTE|nr:hypothetical protein DM860_016743 [Cuscuta australis]